TYKYLEDLNYLIIDKIPDDNFLEFWESHLVKIITN
ncbi:DeoR/GlpR transcriptional regulator, partial [Staphylococcus succinus]